MSDQGSFCQEGVAANRSEDNIAWFPALGETPDGNSGSR